MKKIILSVFIASVLLTFLSGFVFAEENTGLIRDNSDVLEQAEKIYSKSALRIFLKTMVFLLFSFLKTHLKQILTANCL